jgi:hypothetical protein
LNGNGADSRPVLSEAFCINKLHKRDWFRLVLLSYIDTIRGDSITVGVLSGGISINEYQEKQKIQILLSPLPSL